MKVLFDHLCFNQDYGGVSRYFVELIKRIPKEDIILTVKYSNNEYLIELPGKRLHSFFSNINFKGKARLIREFGKFFSIPFLLKNDFDIYHQTHYDPYAFKYLPDKVMKITTIHDMNFWTIPSYYKNNNSTMRNQIISAKKADHIITISNNSKNDICKYLNIPEEKISVIYHGINILQFNSIVPFELFKPYILFVGSRNKYKNFEGTIKSFSQLKKMHPDLQLYCAGNPASNQEINLLKSFDVLDSVMFFQASDKELIAFYKGAKVFVFPSFYEGFGIPILEAMASNCPVALSNTSCFPEIAQDAAAYFDPYNIDDITSTIDIILSDENYSSSLKKKGAKRVKDFSWDKSVKEHLKIYQSLL
jgi:glycosyltransferase involved in cell wall biosynthesis